MYAIIDIETTGGNALTDKITEIAIYVHDGEKVIDEYSTLINPGRTIPPYVQQLTGITDKMVSVAPTFSEVAEEIKRFTENYIFVAHNSQFDYSFVRQEFRGIGYSYTRPTICTVSFSRKILPGFRSYGLSSLCEKLTIGNSSRHRAAGDALATVKLFEILLEQGGREMLPQVVKLPVAEMQLPDCIRPEVMQKLPSTPGIFYFLNQKDEIIYLGKGLNIRKCVLQIVTKSTNKKSFKMREELHDIRFEETGSVVLATILEYFELKKHKPPFNKKHEKLFQAGFTLYRNSGYLVLRGRSYDEEAFIKLEDGNVTGFTYISKESQVSVEDLMITLPSNNYINLLVQKAIAKRHFLRLINAQFKN